MNRIRRPWTLARQHTDGVQMNTLDDYGNKDPMVDEEKSRPREPEQEVDIQHGHLQEIEVDLDHVIEDREIKDIDGDTSPYPEVVSTDMRRCASISLSREAHVGHSVQSYPRQTTRICQ
jgi:hypothetical protein